MGDTLMLKQALLYQFRSQQVVPLSKPQHWLWKATLEIAVIVPQMEVTIDGIPGHDDPSQVQWIASHGHALIEHLRVGYYYDIE